MIGDFVWFGLRKKIGDLGVFFFFFPSCGLVVAVVVVAVADGRDGCGWCFGCFFGKCDILFYCSGYIILL